MAVLALLEDALTFGALGDLPSARAADLTMTAPNSIAAAPSVPSGNNGSSRSSSSQSSSSAGCPDGVPYSLVRMCLALATFLPTALTELTATSCPETLAGGFGRMSLPHIGGTVAFLVCERHYKAVPSQE